MINSNKKQFIIFLLISIFMISIIGIHFFKSYFKNTDYEIIESSNILENSIENSVEDTIIESAEQYIIVHITGQINNPGIVKLSVNSRIADAITAAGGLTSEANVSSINLAYKLDDGDKIYIPSQDESSNDIFQEENYISTSAGNNIIVNSKPNNNSNSNNELININTATQTELETIPGIGPSTALKIIQYRTENGNFSNIEDLKNISGIGEAKFNNIKKYVTV